MRIFHQRPNRAYSHRPTVRCFEEDLCDIARPPNSRRKGVRVKPRDRESEDGGKEGPKREATTATTRPLLSRRDRRRDAQECIP